MFLYVSPVTVLKKRPALSILLYTSYLLLLNLLEPTFQTEEQGLALTRWYLISPASRKDTIGVSVNTLLAIKSTYRYLKSSLIFLAKRVSLESNVTAKGAALVEFSRIIFFFQKLAVSFVLWTSSLDTNEQNNWEKLKLRLKKR